MKLFKILLLCLSFICLNACSKKEETKYDVYVNNVGYKLNDELIVEVNLKTDNKNIVVCPIIKVEKENEEDISKIVESINFSTDNTEFLNLYATEFSEKYNDGYWSFESILSNDGEEVNLELGDTIERIKIKIVEKGNYTISLVENNESDKCEYKFGDSVSLNIKK